LSSPDSVKKRKVGQTKPRTKGRPGAKPKKKSVKGKTTILGKKKRSEKKTRWGKRGNRGSTQGEKLGFIDQGWNRKSTQRRTTTKNKSSRNGEPPRQSKPKVERKDVRTRMEDEREKR